MSIQTKQSGFALPTVVILFMFLATIGAVMLQFSVTAYKAASELRFDTNAQMAADAGIDLAVYEIAQDDTWVGTPTFVTILNDGEYESRTTVSVSDVDLNTKEIVSVGTTFRTSDPGTILSERTARSELRAVGVGDFSVVTGVGGLYMRNSSRVIGGSVFVNGELFMENTSQIGLTTNPVNVRAAHQNCPDPPDATYPQVCAMGENGEPITLNNSAHIYGDVRATNQTNGTGMTDPGLTAPSTVSPLTYPTYDRGGHVSAANASGNTLGGSAASCTTNGGTVTWPEDFKIIGDVLIEKSCTVYTEGDVWITGDLTMRQSGKMQPVESISERTNIMVDGVVDMNQGSSFGWNSSEESYQVITHTSDATCSPDCADVTGVDLYNSRNDTTIDIRNSSSGEKTIFFARWTQVSIDNSGGVGAVVGQTIELLNSTTITFGASAPGGEDQFWVLDNYRRTF